MGSISASEMAGVFTDTGLSVVTDMYDPEALWFSGLVDVGDIADVSDPIYGDKSSTIVVGTGLDEYELGVEAQLSGAVRGWTPQGKIRRFHKGGSITMEELEANGGVDKALKVIAEFTKQHQTNHTASINRRMANIFLKGAHTAGAPDTFQASYRDNPVSFDGFYCDGEPLFDDAHPLKAPNGSVTTYDNYMASLGLDPTNFQLAYDRMSVTNAINEAGDAVEISPKYIIGGSKLRGAMFNITNDQNTPGTANNQGNVWRGVVDHRVVKQFGTSEAWFLLADPRAIKVRISNGGNLKFRAWFHEATNSMRYEWSGAELAYPRDARFLLAANSATS